MQELVVKRGAEELVAVPLERDVYRLGRAPTNDLAIPEQAVSRHQCQLLRDGKAWTVKDSSGKGTPLDGKRVKSAAMPVGSELTFGALTLSIRDRAEASGAQPTASVGGTDVLPRGKAPAKLRLVGRQGDNPLVAKLNVPVLTIGSDPGNDIRLSDGFVSSFHCRVFKKDSGWFVSDLGSTNGTRVNGVQVAEAKLEPGATLQIGELALKVQAEHKTANPLGFHGIVSEDPSMQPVFELIERAAPTDETVLITGESGCGKELVAVALHQLSRRSVRPLIPLNCSAITKDLLESELFGHEKGAFTGAQTKRRGLFEEADGGTLLLDEIGELALDLQAKLLRVLENGEIRPVGSNQAKRVDTRVLAATHRSLPERVRDGDFREDLFYRIDVIEIALPPLRKRPADIPVLARLFLEQATRQTSPRTLSQAAIEHLCTYRFPGNVRELKHTITRAAILSPHETIEPEHLSFNPPSLADRVAEGQIYRRGMTLREVEIETVRAALKATDYNQKAAARELGIARSTLITKMEKYDLQQRDP
jgi:two-component system response regulator HydG